MRDSFNSMLMTIGPGSTFSSANNTAATFASAAKELTQTATSSQYFESGSINNNALDSDSDLVRFNDILKGELKSFITQPAATPAKQAVATNITRGELTEVAKALQREMADAPAAGKAELATLLDTEPKPAPPIILDEIDGNDRTANELSHHVGASVEQMPEHATEQLQQIGIASDDSANLIEFELQPQLSQASEAVDSQGDKASLQSLTSNDLVTQIEQLSEAVDSQGDKASLQSLTSNDLVTQLEQLIKPLANSEQLQAQLVAIKQSFNQQGEPVPEQPIEQEIEHRINQPIEQLIRQPLAANYDIKAKGKVDTGAGFTLNTGKDQTDADLYSKTDGGDDGGQTAKIEALISKLPPDSQQQLVAAMNNNEAQELQSTHVAPKGVRVPINSLAASERTMPDSVTPDMKLAPAAIVAPDAKPDTGVSLSNLPAASLVSNQVNSDKKPAADKIHAEISNADETNADVQQETSNGKGEISAKTNTAGSFDSLLRQMEMTTQRGANANGVEQESVTSQLAAADKSHDSALAAKEPLNQATKIPAEQLLSKLPLAQDTPAAKMLKERVSMMVTGKIQQAVIQLDPEELGGMNIRLQIQNDQMSVQFQVQNAQAKEMLENAMVKLREMLDQQGIVLKDSDVQQQDQRQPQDLADQSHQQALADEDFVSDQDAIVLTLHKQSSDGIDYYA